MRRAPALFVVVGVVAGITGLPVQAKQTTQSTEGFWVSLAAGASGSSTPSAYNEFWFDSPHAPPISVTQATGAGTVQATTGGGSTFFTAAGTPILIPTTDGYATLSSSSASFPSSALPRFASGTQASGAPQGGGTIPANADLLSLGFSNPSANGSQTLTVSATTPGGTSLGQTSVSVPGNGWWAVGLGPGTNDSITSPITTGGGTSGGGGTGGGTPISVPTAPSPGSGSGGSGGSVTTPEPTSLLLLGFGGITAAGWRRYKK